MGRFTTLGEARVEVRAPTDKLRRDLKGAQRTTKSATKNMVRSVDKMRLSISRVRANVLAYKFAWTGTAIAVGFAIKKLTSAAIEQERVVAQLDARLRSTGGAAGFVSSEMQLMASALQSVTTFGDEAIIGAQSMLLTFTNIGKKVFPKALESALDMATAFGGDLQSAILQVGKALNDPVLGVTALSRVGIQFTESQKAMIAELVEANDVLGAQTLILNELEVQFGGAARAARDTMGGAITALGGLVGDQFERMGKGILEHFNPVIKRSIKLLEELSDVQFLKDFEKTGKDDIANIAKAIEITTIDLIEKRIALQKKIAKNTIGEIAFESKSIRVLRDKIKVLEENNRLNIDRLAVEKGLADALEVIATKQAKVNEAMAESIHLEKLARLKKKLPVMPITELSIGEIDTDRVDFMQRANLTKQMKDAILTQVGLVDDALDAMEERFTRTADDFNRFFGDPLADTFFTIIDNMLAGVFRLDMAFQQLIKSMAREILRFMAMEAVKQFFKLFLKAVAFYVNPGVGAAVSIGTELGNDFNPEDFPGTASFPGDGGGTDTIINVNVGEDRLAQAVLRAEDFELRRSVI